MVSIDGGEPFFVIFHLFSGRRRHNDFHSYVIARAESLGVPVKVISVDTAVAPVLGDLSSSSRTWCFLLESYALGRCSGTLVGSPCETFSQARHQPPPDGVSNWPRPLRSFDRIFGLDRLKWKEYRQAAVGHDFALQGLRALAEHISHGGVFCSEHPGLPDDPTKASVWTMALTTLLRQHTAVKLHHVQQFRWGAASVKPTGLLLFNAPQALQHLYRFADWSIPKPEFTAIGKSSSGSFNTSSLKEYPAPLCQGFAEVFCLRLWAAYKASDTRVQHVAAGSPWHVWFQEMAHVSEQIRLKEWLPDYQG